jgi:hypothetical protein
LDEGFGFYGQAGKAGWTIARRCIAIAMDQGGSFKMRRQVVRLIHETHRLRGYRDILFQTKYCS